MRSPNLLACIAAGAVIGAGLCVLPASPRSLPLVSVARAEGVAAAAPAAAPAAELAPLAPALATLAHADSTPRRRTGARASAERSPARKESSTRERTASRERSSSRERSASRERTSTRERSTSRERTVSSGRTSTQERSASRERSALRERASTRERTAERERVAARERTAERERAAARERTAERERVAARERTAERERNASRESTAAAVLRTSRAVLGAARLESGAQGLRVQRALARLGSRVNTSDRDALRMAFRAYYNYRAEHPENVRKPYLYFVDYGLDAETPRGYVFDMSELRIVEGPFTVAHGRGSAARGGVPRRFSNRHGSEATSLGLFVAQETYSFSGRTGGRVYNSIGLRLRGVSGRFNARARERGVVVHGAPYVTRDGAGCSEGCPAVSPARARTVIPRIRNGGMVFLYSPHDRAWKSEDPWANRGKG